MGKFVPVEELDVYRLAEALADAIWDAVTDWSFFAKDTVGKQLVRAADSVGANIAEGAGDGTPIENRRFVRYARRSLREVRFFLRRAYRRNLLTQTDIDTIEKLMSRMGPLLTAYFRTVDGRCRTHDDSPTHRLTDSPILEHP